MKRKIVKYSIFTVLFLWVYDCCVHHYISHIYHDRIGDKHITIAVLTDDSTIYKGRVYTRGIYVTPQKLRRHGLPDSNYVQLNYLDHPIDPFFYKWENDTFYFRCWGWTMIENKFQPNSKLDKSRFKYYFLGIDYDEQDPEVIIQKKAWKEHFKDYHVLERDGWGGFNYYTFPDFLKELEPRLAKSRLFWKKYLNQNKKEEEKKKENINQNKK